MLSGWTARPEGSVDVVAIYDEEAVCDRLSFRLLAAFLLGEQRKKEGPQRVPLIPDPRSLQRFHEPTTGVGDLRGADGLEPLILPTMMPGV